MSLLEISHLSSHSASGRPNLTQGATIATAFPQLFDHVRAEMTVVSRVAATDPNDEDALDDVGVTTSDRRIGRVATVAAEVGMRFARERIEVDPVAWMHAPRDLFGGRTALDAVQDREHFERAMILHGLSLGMDAHPEDIDDLCADEDEDDAAEEAAIAACGRAMSAMQASTGVPMLFTAVVSEVGDDGSTYVFHARVTHSRAAFERGLRLRVGARLADDAVVTAGYDAGDPVVAALVSEAMDDMLAQIATDPSSPLADGLDLMVEQRFAD